MSSSIGKLSREEFRRQKDLDAARKAGTAPAEVDEEGKDINPHIPQFMAQAPWYLDTGRPSLKHQRKPDVGKVSKVALDAWYARGQKAGPAATKYRKGACENCGAMSHKTRDCLERPRKRGAKWTGKDIMPDEVVGEVEGLDTNYAAKRDRWNGYDPAEYKKVMEEYEAVEEERRRLREEEIDNQTSNDLAAAKKLAKKDKGRAREEEGGDGDFGSSDEDDEDEDKYADRANMVGQKIDSDKRITVRNLRIREDRAKYLYNLNPDSAYYDPKTRSMREAPDPNVRPEDSQYAGDNFHRSKGDSAAMQKLQLFAWQAEARGNDLHLQANPTVNEIQYREFQQKRDKLRESTKGSILDRYGGAEHFDSVPRELLRGQTEHYVEYNQAGKVVKGQERAKAKSKYEEDALDQNHTAVWGSWYDLGSATWGYACCHGTIPNSYCTGRAGIEAAKASAALTLPSTKPATSNAAPAAKGGIKAEETEESKKKKGKEQERGGGKGRGKNRSRSSSVSYSSSDSDSSNSRSRRRGRKSRGRREGGEGRKGGKEESKSYRSNKGMGEGDVGSRLDKSKLKEALLEEEARRNPEVAEKLARREARREAKKPDWLKEAEQINNTAASRGKGKAREQEGDYEVSEEQLEAYRIKNRNQFEDPMANYRDQEE
ncbi:hypothetical protein IE53DRAFT_321959 [Violaceomyces palustris]|uniref:Uncharacterized protein n=1 Tax=Violaceomyces palustris TaxID=1673888 RepID=A0ACD0NMF8_9BASI|nr:hypothetical protein IE53DRAFT_321959 [Violaceomyces palustris]